MKLYEINEEIENLINGSLDRETGEVAPDFEEKYTELNMGRNDKIDNTLAYIKNKQAEADAFDGEIKRLTALKKSAEAEADWLKGYLSRNMEAGKEIFTSAHGKISWRKSERVITEINQLPEEYIKVVTEVKPILVDIKKDIKAGKEVPGAKLVVYQNIQIK